MIFITTFIVSFILSYFATYLINNYRRESGKKRLAKKKIDGLQLRYIEFKFNYQDGKGGWADIEGSMDGEKTKQWGDIRNRELLRHSEKILIDIDKVVRSKYL